MLVVKKENTKRIINIVLFLFFVLNINAQYQAFMKDSVKNQLMNDYSNRFLVTKIIDTDYSINRNTMATFCKLELDIQDYTKIPVKFRLGTVDYVDRLENKLPLYQLKVEK